MTSMWKAALLAGAAWSTISGMAMAQEAPAADNTISVDEVVVTARRREENLTGVPVAVSAFSAEKLERSGGTDITVLSQTTPNITVQTARGSNSTLISYIRGVGQQDPLWGYEPGVGLYVDDVYVARPQGAVLDVYDVERIEVLRGPQGTLFGRNVTRIAFKRGAYLRQFVLAFAELISDRLTKALIMQAMQSPANSQSEGDYGL